MADRAQIVLVVGSLHYDIVVQASHLPRRDETAVGSAWMPKFGGKGGNQAVSACKNGAPTRMVGAVGDDDFGRFLRQGLQAGGVDDRFVTTLPGVGSGMSVAIIDGAGDYAATIVSGANLQIAPDVAEDLAVWDGVGLLVLQNEIPDPVNAHFARAARRCGIPVVLNAAPARVLPPELQTLVDILVVNAVEAEMMGAGPVCSLRSAADAAGQLAAAFDCVIVTAGAHGLAAWGAADEPFQLPAEKVAVVSTHGAGDAFIGALVAALVTGSALQDACRTASAAAARHVGGLS